MNWRAPLLPLISVCSCVSDPSTDQDDETQPTTTVAETMTTGADEGSGADNPALGCAAEIEHDTTDGSSDNIMQTWGAPCAKDADCVDLLGKGAFCLFEAVVYELPLGYCSKPCQLADGEQIVPDDPTCDPNGGVACIGQAPFLQACAVPCTDDAQCGRAGYTCRLMPIISTATDPTFCLMPDCCEDTCEE